MRLVIVVYLCRRLDNPVVSGQLEPLSYWHLAPGS
ncbi:Uncharacterised protein [Mycobacteroides abscessus subsp. bolletii]|nr:Uncharacterised protein [Mycobacteroides abscessus subsp. bolletii]SKF80492.1 Uncharacterised protein [Mycobacteroides abscessus subsp. bolletii]